MITMITNVDIVSNEISMCSIKCEIKVKVTKFYISLKEFINIYKATKCDISIINYVQS